MSEQVCLCIHHRYTIPWKCHRSACKWCVGGQRARVWNTCSRTSQNWPLFLRAFILATVESRKLSSSKIKQPFGIIFVPWNIIPVQNIRKQPNYYTSTLSITLHSLCVRLKLNSIIRVGFINWWLERGLERGDCDVDCALYNIICPVH